MRGYTYNNSSPHAIGHHAALAGLLDPFTRQRVRGLPLQLYGKRCLDVGAGGGSIAIWLADQAGPDGTVCATDININTLPVWPGVQVFQHDVTDSPFTAEGGGGFDLVHARLVLNHLPERDVALHHMVGSLKPGGWLLTQDFIPTEPQRLVLDAPTSEAADLLQRFQDAHLTILRDNGNDRTWPGRVAEVLADERSMQDLRVVIHDTGRWHGGDAGCHLLLAGLHQVEDQLPAAGIDISEVNRLDTLLRNPDVILRGYQVHSVSGYKTAQEAA